MLLSATFISVGRLQPAEQPQLFYKSAAKPVPHPKTSQRYSSPGRTMVDAVQEDWVTGDKERYCPLHCLVEFNNGGNPRY
ncbi:hypothetical protein D3C76_1229070 [compost metagenome]